jgi:hypothetical protein
VHQVGNNKLIDIMMHGQRNIKIGGMYVNHGTFKINIQACYCNDVTAHTRVTH